MRWKNFLSTGNNFTEIQLDRSSSTLIIGENGAGKSTILDALCFGLFNKPFRNISKKQLVNTVNNGGSVVEVEFNVGGKDVKVIRGIKPNIFEVWVNGNMINQDANARDYQKHLEQQIMGLNYRSFTQVVILGSSTFVPFMQLPTKARREVVEDILDIKIFSLMNFLLKNKTFACIFNRFMWEDAEQGVFRDNRRVRSALVFKNVLNVKSQNINVKKKSTILEFLAIEISKLKQNGNDFDIHLVKTDDNGNQQWTQTFGGISYNEAYDIKSTLDGGYIICGEKGLWGAGDDRDAYLIKTDNLGNKEWENTYGGSIEDGGQSVIQTDDGGFSSSTVRPSMDYYQRKKSIVLNELSRKLKTSSYKRN